jgi:hypothetical protein
MRSTTGQEIRKTFANRWYPRIQTTNSLANVLPLCTRISWATASFRIPYSARCDVVQGSDQRPKKDFKSAEGNLVGVRPPLWHQNKHTKMNSCKDQSLSTREAFLRLQVPVIPRGCFTTLPIAAKLSTRKRMSFMPYRLSDPDLAAVCKDGPAPGSPSLCQTPRWTLR